MNNVEKICCFTGHRRIPDSEIIKLKQRLDETIDQLIDNGVRTFRTGGALGFDTLAALSVLVRKEKRAEKISLELCLPCRDQPKSWRQKDVDIYNFILSRADKITYLHDEYTASCMLERNRFMVDGSDFCVAYCTSPSSPRGGTAYTVRYANSKNLPVINIA